MTLYETNIVNQPAEWRRLLDIPIPTELKTISYEKIYFVGIGSSYCVARIAEFLWKEHVINTLVNHTSKAIEPLSVQSFDFVKSYHDISDKDIVVVFSHRASKTFSIQALEVAKKYGARTVLVTGIGSPSNPKADFILETCVQEKSEAFTISVTSAITRIIQWIGLYDKSFVEKFKTMSKAIEEQLPFEIEKLPRYTTKLIIVGDLVREIISYETAFKIAETTYLPVRSFGLEEFMHGHHLTLDKLTSLVIFSSLLESRRHILERYGKAVGCEVICMDEEKFATPKEFRWLAQLVWGQQLASALSKQLNTNPDIAREDQYIYREARNILKL
ncbi:MAG TPA: SIS domain-containing protein [Nitrososphaeraceae archaeon]|nr:SIS domain-containing protein [Nitrososphaeraceae archaeon]